MKWLLYTLILLSKAYGTLGQARKYIHPSLLEIHFSLSDFKNSPPFSTVKNMNGGLTVSFTKGINNYFDWKLSLNGTYPDSAIKSQPASSEKAILLEADFSLRARMFRQPKLIQPYLLAGVGVTKYQNSYAIYNPIGAGFQIRLFKETYVLLNSQYRFVITGNMNSHYFYSFGLASVIGKGKPTISGKTPVLLPPVNSRRDRDNDGIVDTADACPDQPGLAAFEGCPDVDNDGIPDKNDLCPTVPGLQRYLGCPVPDTDKDGINDEEDKCPSIPGLVRYQGCPVPDRDGDGVNDEEDKCVDVPGLKENAGCPLISKNVIAIAEIAASKIYFETGSAKLLAVSYTPLNEIVRILKKDTALKLNIEGHTDNAGTLQFNQLLSQRRAQSVLQYLKAHGVPENRLSAKGFGQERPVADNSTSEGRTKNRRVELRLFY